MHRNVWILVTAAILAGCGSDAQPSEEPGPGGTHNGSGGSASAGSGGKSTGGPGGSSGSGMITDAATITDAPADPMPMLLSQTGLYANTATGELAAGVVAFQPQFALWSDGATKKRWVKLPAGAKIDTTDMDFW